MTHKGYLLVCVTGNCALYEWNIANRAVGLLYRSNFCNINYYRSITVASLSKEWTVFACSNTGIVGSNSTQGMDGCVYSAFLLSCVGCGLATDWSPVQGALPTVLGLGNWSETKRFHGCPMLQSGSNRKREREHNLMASIPYSGFRD
jgi:hypothetical protein